MTRPPRDMAQSFAAHYDELLQSRLQVGFVVGVFLVPAFAVVDWFHAPRLFPLFLGLRLAAAALMAGMFYINRRWRHRWLQEGLTLAGALAVAGALEAMLVALGGMGNNYYAGITLVLIAALVLIPVRTPVAALIGLAVLAVYLIPMLTLEAVTITRAAAVHNAATMASATLLLLVANLLHRRALLRQLLLRTQVETKERELAALNRSLEEKVAQRTADLARSESRYRSLVENNPQIIYTLDLAGAFTFLSPQALGVLGREPGHLLGRPFTDIVQPEDRPACMEAFTDIVEQVAARREVEFKAPGPDGGQRILVSYAGPVRDEAGRLTGVIGTAVDVTQERAMARQLGETLAQLEQAAFEVVQGLAGAVEAKDTYTRGHAHRVRLISLAIARQAGLGRDERKLLEYAAELHDLGKIGIKGEVLHKKAPLTDLEYDHIKQHPAIAERILKDVGLMAPARPLIRAHHERFDGSGYPDGLAGEDIPLISRIMAVADSFDAMRTRRPYRPPLDLEEALKELAQGAGSQFDPQVVAWFQEAAHSDEVPGMDDDQPEAVDQAGG